MGETTISKSSKLSFLKAEYANLGHVMAMECAMSLVILLPFIRSMQSQGK